MKKISNMPIGIFDSGVGGLTVAKGIRKALPFEDIIYYGDTARVPYGNKSRSTIIRFAHEIADFLVDSGVKMIIVACNTASSLSLGALKDRYPIPVLGVISPGVREAVRISKNKRIGVIGTRSTVNSHAYNKELKKKDKKTRVFSKCCPLFVPLVENRFVNDSITYQVAEKYLHSFRGKDIDTMILGCTHYPVLKNVIKNVMEGVKLVDSPSAVARECKDILDKNDMLSERKRMGRMKCYVSDDIEGFKKTAGIFLKEKVPVKKAVV